MEKKEQPHRMVPLENPTNINLAIDPGSKRQRRLYDTLRELGFTVWITLFRGGDECNAEVYQVPNSNTVTNIASLRGVHEIEGFIEKEKKKQWSS